MAILTTLYTLAVVLFLFGLTIFVHELGHFLVARRCGMVIDAFSIGFGPAIWKRTMGGVVYKIGILPLGGYVALPQMDPSGEGLKAGGEGRELPRVAPGKKILVALAGVVCNMVLAYLIAHVVYLGGQSFAPVEESCVVGFVETNSQAYAAGIRMGDTIEEVSGRPVKTWDEFVLRSALAERAVLKVRRKDAGAPLTAELPTEEFLGSRFVPGLAPLNYCYVLGTAAGSSAEAAGIQGGDRIVRFDGVELYSRQHLMALVDERRGQTSPVVVDRKGTPVELSVTPKYDEAEGRALIGVLFNTLDVKKPWAQVKAHAKLIFNLLHALVTPKEAKAAAGAVGGPVAIFGMFWLYVQGSFIMALWFTCLLNVNLAILNLLPLPVLDGGHIVLSLWEMVTRRPVSPRVVSVIWNAGVVLLLTLFLTLTYRDCRRLAPSFFGKGAAPAEATTNAPAAPAPAAP
jgi:regulator of sigma E protease